MAASLSSLILRQTLRRLRRERGFTATVLLTLALCIGANIAIFAVVDAILVRSLPFPHAGRLVTMINSYPGAGAVRTAASLPNYYDRRDHIEAFESVAIRQSGSAIVGETGSPMRLARDRVSPEFFATLGVPLAMGRTFTEDEMLYANSRVLILTDQFWRSHFQADPNVVGRALAVDGLPHVVIGVLPPGFRYLDGAARFFVPLASNLDDRGPGRRHGNNVELIGRLKPGVTVAAAQAQVDAFNDVQLQEDPHAQVVRDAGFRTHVYSLHDDAVRTVKPVLVLLQGGVLSLLLIGAVNLVNLLLIRAHGRAKEMTVRQALGATRRHLIHETLIETVLLALAGGALGLAVGAGGIRLLDALGTDRLPLGASIAFDGRIALIALVGSLLVGVVLAVPVVAFGLRREIAPGLQAESRGGTASRAAQSARHAFIIVQIGLALALISGAGLLGLSLQKALATSPGFEPDAVLTARVELPWKNYPEPAVRQAFLERLLGELRRLPGVVHAGFGTGVPFIGRADDNATTVEGVERTPGDSIRTHYTSMAMGDYWQALGIPLIEGRYLENDDNHREQRVCVVDQAFAQRYWPNQSALGRRIASDVNVTKENAMTVVGVVGTVKQNDLTDRTPLGAVYQPFRLRPGTGISVVLRTSQAPETMGPTLQKLVLSLDPQLPVDDIKLARQWIDDSLLARRSPAMLVGIFAVVALLLAAIGTYGVLAYAVSQRRREIGVRLALGAQPGQVLRHFVGVGLRLLAVGLGLGLVCAYVAGAVMRGLLFDVPIFHLGIILVAAISLTIVVLCATLLPSQRAARVSPLEALRDD